MVEKEAKVKAVGVPADGQLEGGTYEIIRNRLLTHGKELRSRIDKLNSARKGVFGAVETKLLSSQRISTENNCIPRDMVPVDHKFLFGYNVFVGLRSETRLSDTFSAYNWLNNELSVAGLEFITDSQFEADFQNLYKYYRNARFSKFSVIGPHLFMVFRVGKDVTDIKTFKWLIQGSKLKYLNNRSDHEHVFPSQHEFAWKRVTQDMHRGGASPHISIEDRIFVETVGGDLTIKIEDNTETGEGIYSEPVDDPDQTLADADIHYAILDNLVILKVLPYQEKNYRYVVYNEKLQQAVRIDAIKDACVLLPEGRGLIFSNGYYLQTGQRKQFETDMEDMVFEKRISSPNGEDFLYIFYNRDSGVYILLSYNLIEQRVDTPVICHGYSGFEDGTMLYFRASDEAQKQHVVQVWQTPYYGPDYQIEVKHDSQLYDIGNKDIVQCMAECSALLTLIGKEESYTNLYTDISKLAQNIIDGYFWLKSDEAGKLDGPLNEIKAAASSAIDEYEKVVRTRQNTRQEIERVSRQVRDIISDIDFGNLKSINTFVEHLMKLRSVRGEVISLKELRYADMEQVEGLESEVAGVAEKLSGLCVEFLLDAESLSDYQVRIEKLRELVPEIVRVAQAKEAEQDILKNAGELEMLTEIVSNLKIEDATQTATIIDNISLVYATVNQVRSALKNKMKELAAVEGRAEFGAQIKLLEQSAINFLDLCSSPEKCDEYLTKVMVQIETLESKFADYDEFVGELTEKREEIYNTFESRKVQLVSQRNQRTDSLMTAAQRILKGIRSRVTRLNEINEINGYFASDLMVERVRETVRQLEELGDTVKSEDVKSQLKSLQQEAVRQLKDRQGLYEDSENVIRLGSHKFTVNRQNLEGTTVERDNKMFYHLTGTGFFEEIEDEELAATADVWSMDVLSENAQVYRGEYLAYKMFNDSAIDAEMLRYAELNEVVATVQKYMGPRFAEGYVKGVHDVDGAVILQGLLQMAGEIGLLRYGACGRALAVMFWRNCDERFRKQTAAKILSMGYLCEAFGTSTERGDYVDLLRKGLEEFVRLSGLFGVDEVDEAAEYLFEELCGGGEFCVSQAAVDIQKAFELQLSQEQEKTLREALDELGRQGLEAYKLLRDWLKAFIRSSKEGWLEECADEAAAYILDDESVKRVVVAQSVESELEGLVGTHDLIENGNYRLHYCRFMTKLRGHEAITGPKFAAYQQRKKELVDYYEDKLRLSEFMPRVLSSFVRNKLIDKVYLPLIGDNLAKQIGTAGVDKRTDRQGLLLMISPPGYGKTTLMEYVANRLGLIFMKINGPVVGNRVTSFDPDEASNVAAREEIHKLNLAFEMGDNIMIYVDDIQHCNPEFLQKFISLCDAQRRVEGVYQGRSRTYDLRGKRVCVVMAGNPYTESGEKFKIPDMLANRADTYNIGDIVGDNYDSFVLSYIENCLTSNPILGKLANRSQKDVYQIIKLAEMGNRDDVEFEANYAVDELNEYVNTMKKLFTVRDVVLTVNQHYIRSAGQADEYRTEPSFLLQGSYRNMNRIAGRVLPVLNDEELWTLIYSNYEQDAQTLTSGVESNLLKFRELTRRLDEQQTRRWNEIKKTFGRNQMLGGDSDDKVNLMIRQLSSFGAGLDSIKDVLAEGVQKCHQQDERIKVESKQENEHFQQTLGDLTERMGNVVRELQAQRQELHEQSQLQQGREAQESGDMLLSVLEEQFKTMETWLMRVTKNREGQQKYVRELIGRFDKMISGYAEMKQFLTDHYHSEDFDRENEKKAKRGKKGK